MSTIFGRALLALVLYSLFVIVLNGVLDDAPVDYRRLGVVGGLTLAIIAVPAGLVLAVRRARGRALRPVNARSAAGLVVVGLVAAGAVGAWRGVVTPWAPIATQADAACPALARAGLTETARTKTRDEVDHNDLGVFSYCSWTTDATAETLDAAVYLYDGDRLGTAIGWAIGSYRDRRGNALAPVPLTGIGDEAFEARSGDRVTVTARHANVVIQVEFYGSAGGGVAEDLVRKMVAAVLRST